MEGMAVKSGFWPGKRIFVTGHTGFKGGWLSLWLKILGAKVHGYSLPPPTDPNFFTEVGLIREMANHTIADISDKDALIRIMQSTEPEIVFHLAAQSLVRSSYVDPVATYGTNVMGTVHLLESVRLTPSVRAVVIITSDKCYDNRGWVWGYREKDLLGGFDPYASSKACAELVTSAYRHSFFEKSGVAVASARSGNVIGGGDWATDRLLPDFLRAMDRNQTLNIRFPEAVRPWQHVLEPLSGYLTLAEHLYEEGQSFAEAWNFGPEEIDAKSVRWIVDQLSAAVPGVRWEQVNTDQPYETHFLKLDSSKARIRLGWRPRWRLETALAKTLEWHMAWRRGANMKALTLAQIAEYSAAESNDEQIPI